MPGWLIAVLVIVAILRLAQRLLTKRGVLSSKKSSGKSGATNAPKNKTLYTIRTFARIGTRRYFRDKTAIFFTVAFPLIFLFVFGGLSKGNDVSFHVALINQSDTVFAKQLTGDIQKNKTFNLRSDVTNLDHRCHRSSPSTR